jgi:hypothetical protein
VLLEQELERTIAHRDQPRRVLPRAHRPHLRTLECAQAGPIGTAADLTGYRMPSPRAIRRKGWRAAGHWLVTACRPCERRSSRATGGWKRVREEAPRRVLTLAEGVEGVAVPHPASRQLAHICSEVKVLRLVGRRFTPSREREVRVW